ncbi:ORF6N domain-containing protein [Massilia sp. erpn]|uniref:ORF6N domain-containing protein n=1 Tax=Massilia sp. erpn TaxID=2738142 RepID=UPI002105E278|nr:ORF6N domain-containing protein [Massilia sp. erpn]UTY57520.1 ORF6N domain-containing protein [Massilia sp. erpn]
MPVLIDEEENIAHAPDQDGICRRIILLREKKVLLDTDLAGLYEVSTKRFNEQVKRNLGRFPADFMFQRNADEYAVLRSQFATLKQGQHRKYLPYAFTEHGAIMAAMLMNSPRAISISVHVVRAFVQLRALAAPPVHPAKRPIGFVTPEDRTASP